MVFMRPYRGTHSLEIAMVQDKIEETLARHSRGLVIVITGDGKGKTTAALGQALRALGHGKKVLMIQFMKGRKYGEVLCAEQCLPNLTFKLCGLDSFVMRGNPAQVDVDLARAGLDLAKEAIRSEQYDMVILDEINVAVDFGLVGIEDVLSMLKEKPAKVDVILTGRYAHPEIVALADTVSEVKEVKHHYAQGIKERAGIEF
jgi:cob(I)alamin adenosyltransferase